MTRFCFIYSLLLVSLTGFAQKASRNSYGFSLSVGQPANFVAVIGSTDISGKSFGADFRFYRRLSRNVRFESGLGWHSLNYSSRSANPNGSIYHDEVRTLYIPALLRVSAWKGFFFQAGFRQDIDIRNVSANQRQTGVGIEIGGGFEWPLLKNWLVQINPYLHYNPLWFSSADPTNLVDRGIRLGLRQR